MNLVEKIISLAESIGARIKNVDLKIGDLSNLQTSNKTSIVSSINEVIAAQSPQTLETTSCSYEYSSDRAD
jgi:hypothetical protein